MLISFEDVLVKAAFNSRRSSLRYYNMRPYSHHHLSLASGFVVDLVGPNRFEEKLGTFL